MKSFQSFTFIFRNFSKVNCVPLLLLCANAKISRKQGLLQILDIRNM